MGTHHDEISVGNHLGAYHRPGGLFGAPVPCGRAEFKGVRLSTETAATILCRASRPMCATAEVSECTAHRNGRLGAIPR